MRGSLPDTELTGMLYGCCKSFLSPISYFKMETNPNSSPIYLYYSVRNALRPEDTKFSLSISTKSTCSNTNVSKYMKVVSWMTLNAVIFDVHCKVEVIHLCSRSHTCQNYCLK